MRECNKEKVKYCVVDDDESEATMKFNSHFVLVSKKLAFILLRVRVGFYKLEIFVHSKKDPNTKYSIPPISESFLTKNLKVLSPNKATGVNKVSARILAAPIITPFLTKEVNSSLQSGCSQRDGRPQK